MQEMGLLNLIKPLLAHVYCSITRAKHSLIRLIDSSRELAFIYAISFVINLYLIFLISVQTSDAIDTKVISPRHIKENLAI